MALFQILKDRHFLWGLSTLWCDCRIIRRGIYGRKSWWTVGIRVWEHDTHGRPTGSSPV